MSVVKLTFSLFWRLVVAWFVVGCLILLLNLLATSAGARLIPTELAASPTFIKLKPSLMYLVAAFVALISELAFRINPLELVAGRRLQLLRAAWRRLSFGLVALLLVLAVLNVLVAIFAGLELWLQYKLFGAFALLLLGLAFLARGTQPSRNAA